MAPHGADLARRLARLPGLAWLDGGLEHGREGRYSFLATTPVEVRASAPEDADPLRLLGVLAGDLADLAGDDSDACNEHHRPHRKAGPGPADVPAWVGHVTYDAGRRAHPARHARDTLVPALRFARYDAWVALDHADGSAYLVGDDRAACERLEARLDASPADDDALAFAAGPVDATPAGVHEHAVQQALALIHAGEVYEINLARRLRARFDGSALGLYLRMRAASPVPLGYFVDGGTHTVLGRSMELFLRYRAADRRLWTSPIKGTVARAGRDADEAQQLTSDPKEHAEHAMVVDLMRNDLSRVCEVGSVSVSALMEVLPFAGLSHLVSTVEGKVRADVDVAGVIAETFPPGSVTGAPKHRVIDAIEALEAAPRGLYTGCVGFLDRAGGCALAVAIRTAVVEQGRIDYFAGGGIVADSVPARETAETELKARMYLEALTNR